MRPLKSIVIILLIILLSFPSFAEKRAPKLKMEELTNPDSPTYVPYPYPKNRWEIIEDMRYCYVDLSSKTNSTFIGEIPINKLITMDLFSDSPRYKFGKIVKVKNRASYYPDDYSWLVYVMDEEGDAVMRIAIMASGLVMGDGAIDKRNFDKYPPELVQSKKRRLKIIEDKEIKKVLSEFLGTAIDDQIKKMERIDYTSTLGDELRPMWEIKMKNGDIFYYSENRDMIYMIEKKVPWKKDKKGRRPFKYNLVGHHNYVPDGISDELIVLEPMPRKKNK